MICVKDAWDDYGVKGMYKYKVSDVSKSRVMEHAKNGIMTISACNKSTIPYGVKYEDMSPEQQAKWHENVERTDALQKDLRNEGFGYISAVGGYIESDEHDPQKKLDVTELTCIVPKPQGMSFEDFIIKGIRLGNKYGQESIGIAGVPFINNGQAALIPLDRVPDTDNFELIAESLENLITSGRMDMFSKTTPRKEVDPKERPYYTEPKKLNGFNFTWDSASQRFFDHYVGFRVANGMTGHLSAQKRGEILV